MTEVRIEQLACTLVQRLIAVEASVSCAESCTGGGIAYALTSVAGSSAALNQSYVTYSNQAKSQLLGVSEQVIAQQGAVSLATVRQMAAGCAKAAQADLALAVSGIAGPGGGSAAKPVGTVCFAWYWRGQLWQQQRRFSGDRREVRQQAIAYALECAIKLCS